MSGSHSPREALTVGRVIGAALALLTVGVPAWQGKILRALAACRTRALGGHRYVCAHCGREHFLPHACRNRHCPDCQAAAAVDWLQRQIDSLLPIPYFHLVFTLPHDLNPLIAQNPRPLLNLFFATVSATLLEFGQKRFGAQLGLTLILHTWGQSLIDHYHLHVLATGGGLQSDPPAWVPAPPYFLFPVHALSRVFRAKFCDGLQRLYAQGQLEFHGQLQPLSQCPHFQALLRQATRPAWNVYVKRPFAGPQSVLTYLSGYTHRVALSSRRLQRLDLPTQTVTFTYKDYADAHRIKPLTLSLAEFLRRFCLHLLPERFVKIRHYGLLANRQRQPRLQHVRQLLGAAGPPDPQGLDPAFRPTDPAPLRCPYCGAAALELVEIIRPPRPGTPAWDDTS